MSELRVIVRTAAEDARIPLGRVRVRLISATPTVPRETLLQVLETVAQLHPRMAKQKAALSRTQRIADKHADAIRHLFLGAVKKGRAAYRVHGLQAALQEIEASLHSMKESLRLVVVAAGEAAVKVANAKGIRAAGASGVVMSFNNRDAAAAAWAEEHAGEMIVDISEETRKAVAEIIAQAQRDGLSTADQAEMLKNVIGLNERDALAVYNSYDAALEEGTDESEAMNDALIYADELLDGRAEMIARTETQAAANEGQSEAWAQAVDAGLLPPDTLREWLASSGCCDDCDEMDGQTVELDAGFETPDGDEIDAPPLHPRCRCGQGIAAADAEPTDQGGD